MTWRKISGRPSATDMIDKQAALDDAITRLDTNERRLDNLRWRVDESESTRNRLDAVGPGRYYPPRHPTHSEPSFLESHGIL